VRNVTRRLRISRVRGKRVSRFNYDGRPRKWRMWRLMMNSLHIRCGEGVGRGRTSGGRSPVADRCSKPAIPAIPLSIRWLHKVQTSPPPQYCSLRITLIIITSWHAYHSFEITLQNWQPLVTFADHRPGPIIRLIGSKPLGSRFINDG
jgi:hypothetical protein